MKTISREVSYATRTSILINGEMAAFRLMERSDAPELKRFFSSVTEQEADSLRVNVRDPATIDRWMETLDYRHVLPLVAWDEPIERVVGVSTLHFNGGVHQHVADIWIFIGKAHRKLGLGSAMIKELIELANQQRLFFLRAEVLTDNQLAIRAFRQLGFEVKCTLEDYFMSPRGATHDVMLMMKRLRMNMEEDFFYVF